MEPEEVSKLDQGMAFLANSLPMTWRRMYLNLIEEGFTNQQAMELLKTYIHGSAGGNYRT